MAMAGAIAANQKVKRMSKSSKSNAASNSKKPVGFQPQSTPKKLGGCTGKGFLPGRSGNPGGKRNGEVSLTAWIKRHLASGKRLSELGRAIYASAVSGDVAAQKLLWERLDGPVKQEFEAKFMGAMVHTEAVQVIEIPSNNRRWISEDATPAALLPPSAPLAQIVEPLEEILPLTKLAPPQETQPLKPPAKPGREMTMSEKRNADAIEAGRLESERIDRKNAEIEARRKARGDFAIEG
jgi:hypothetical protein